MGITSFASSAATTKTSAVKKPIKDASKKTSETKPKAALKVQEQKIDVVLPKEAQENPSADLDERDRKLGAMVRQLLGSGALSPNQHVETESHASDNIRTGWYAGGLVGATIHQTRLIVQEGYIGITSYSFKKRFENTLPALGASVGKQFVHGKLLTDVNGFILGSFTNNKTTINNSKELNGTYINSLKEKYRVGINVALGTPIAENFSAFGKIGLTYSNFSFHYINANSRGNFGKKIVGIAPGVLFKYNPTSKFGMSLDINYLMGLNNMKSGNISSKSTFSYTANVRPQVLTILLGVNRTF